MDQNKKQKPYLVNLMTKFSFMKDPAFHLQ